MTESERAEFQKVTEQSEGRTSWLYLDTTGNATCGIGHLVSTFAHALSLPFSPPIEKPEWDALATSPKGLRAQSYQIDSRGRLSDQDIDKLFLSDLTSIEGGLRHTFPSYDRWPGTAQMGMLDVAYNAGLARFPRLVVAAKTQDWGTCAIESHRNGIATERNERTSNWFRMAQSVVKDVL
jgi:GH24 family phage-related lysozyme (muramidase)